MSRIPIVLLLLTISSTLYAAADREASRSAIVLPIAGTVNGAYGTRFQTDVTIANQAHDPRPTIVDVYWLPQGSRGATTPLLTLTLPHGTIATYDDFVTRTLQVSGLGSIVFRAVNADGTPNGSARIDAFARVWTPVPGGRGTTSQGVHASTLYTPAIDDFQPIPAVIYGLLQDSAFRANYGIVNMSDKPITFTVGYRTSRGTKEETIVVEPRSMTQRPVPASESGAVTVLVTPFQGSPATLDIGPWTAYGSSVDNTTGDAWYSKGQAAYPHNER